jgi:hypothetical protein
MVTPQKLPVMNIFTNVRNSINLTPLKKLGREPSNTLSINPSCGGLVVEIPFDRAKYTVGSVISITYNFWYLDGSGNGGLPLYSFEVTSTTLNNVSASNIYSVVLSDEILSFLRPGVRTELGYSVSVYKDPNDRFKSATSPVDAVAIYSSTPAPFDIVAP